MTLTPETHASPAQDRQPTEERTLPDWEDAAQDYKAAQLRLQNAFSIREYAHARDALEQSRATLTRIFEQIWPGCDV